MPTTFILVPLAIFAFAVVSMIIGTAKNNKKKAEKAKSINDGLEKKDSLGTSAKDGLGSSNQDGLGAVKPDFLTKQDTVVAKKKTFRESDDYEPTINVDHEFDALTESQQNALNTQKARKNTAVKAKDAKTQNRGTSTQGVDRTKMQPSAYIEKRATKFTEMTSEMHSSLVSGVGGHHDEFCSISGHERKDSYREEKNIPVTNSIGGTSSEGCENHYYSRFIKLDSGNGEILGFDQKEIAKAMVIGDLLNNPAFKRRPNSLSK